MLKSLFFQERRKLCEYEQIFTSVKPQVTAVVSKYLKRSADVEDIVQEAFLRSYKVWKNNDLENPKHYILRAARNLSLNHLNLHSNTLTQLIHEVQCIESCEGPDPVFNQYEVSEKILVMCEAIEQLPEQCRRVFILKKIHGMGHIEISKTLQITVSNTNKHLAVALSRVTTYMRDLGYLENLNGR